MKKLLLSIYFLIWLVVSCQSSSLSMTDREPLSTPAITVQVVKSDPERTPVVCTPMPDDMTVNVRRLSNAELQIELTGLLPSEQVYFIFTTEYEGKQRQIEEFPLESANSEGQLIFKTSLNTWPESAHNSWQIKVVHARGVACDEVEND